MNHLKLFEEYSKLFERRYADLSEKEKDDFDNATFVDEDSEGNWEIIQLRNDRVWWDKRKKIKRKPTMEEYYTVHGYND